ncbi:IS66 family transposase [Paenibacillus cymbidii]|uniref:IS66 family transposase n=1 Tax=Paenibacillus cymbidii TaxID=1639034 RepID=UPI0010814365|nr:IS66 family transposase [Paenibacillus cymbidii]
MKKIKFKPYAATSYLPVGYEKSILASSPEWKPLFELFVKEVRRLELQAEHHRKIIDAQVAEIERLEAVNLGQRDQLFGRSSEHVATSDGDRSDANDNLPVARTADARAQTRRRRGGQKGHKGYGRSIPNIPEIEVVHEVPANEACCSTCGASVADTGLSEDAYEVDIQIKLVRIHHRRKRAARTCDCQAKRMVTAPKPPAIIPKGKFSHAFLAYVIVMKYVFQVPLHRLLQWFHMQGLLLTASTLIGNFKVLGQRLQPLYERLVQINGQADHWHVDETGWKMFAQSDKKDNANWWLWVFACKQTVVYVVDSSRSASVLLAHLKKGVRGIVSSDRYSSYLKLSRLRPGITNAFCWAHLRRDFLKAGKEHIRLQPWSPLWLDRIRQLYRLNRQRLTVADAGTLLEQAMVHFFAEAQRELQSPDLHPRQRTILKNTLKNQAALCVFVEQPHVPMDNNRAERLLRLAALGRKNYYGCHAQWSGDFTAICLSILQTAAQHGLNAQAYLRYILDELAHHPAGHPDLDALLPWKIPDEQVQAYAMKSGGPPCVNMTFPETSAVGL